MKKCSICGVEKPFEDFHKDKSSKDGRKAACKECTKKRAKMYHQKNKAKNNESSRNWYKNNREKKLKQNKEWINSNVLRRLANVVTRRNKQKYGTDEVITKEALESILESQGGKCYYTNKDMDMTRSTGTKFNDYQISVDRKDSSLPYTKSNIVLCCWRVNQIKNNLSVEELLDWCKLILEHTNEQTKKEGNQT